MWLLRLASLFALTFGLAVGAAAQNPAASAPPPRPAFAVTVAGFADGADLPLKYTAAGAETSPSITWANPPANTVSFVLSMRDMDNIRNRTNEDQVHWLVWNIPAGATGLPEAIPTGAQLPNGAWQISASGLGYRGPGHANNPTKHHYAFELFALDTKLDVPGGGKDAFETRASVINAMQGHVLARAMYMALFRRPQ